MGNYMSCAPNLQSPKAARVILPGGEIRKFRQPVKAAELMLESPNYFLVDSVSFGIGRRVSPLPAEEDLELGSLYVMLPMRRLNSILTAADVAIFLMATNAAPKRVSAAESSGKISPDSEEEIRGQIGEGRRRLRLEAEDLEFKHRRLASCRSKRPGLDTIVEEPLRSR